VARLGERVALDRLGRDVVGAAGPRRHRRVRLPVVAAQGSKVAVSLYHTTTAGAPSTVPEDAQGFESDLESTDGATFGALGTVDPTPVKSGPICTEGVSCSGDRELLDFQSDTIDGQPRANLTWTRSIAGVADTEQRFARQP
jgi:hypothetical protein